MKQILFFLIFLMLPIASANVQINNTTIIIQNVNFSFTGTQEFTSINVSSDQISLNGTIFKPIASSLSPATINIVYYDTVTDSYFFNLSSTGTTDIKHQVGLASTQYYGFFDGIFAFNPFSNSSAFINQNGLISGTYQYASTPPASTGYINITAVNESNVSEAILSFTVQIFNSTTSYNYTSNAFGYVNITATLTEYNFHIQASGYSPRDYVVDLSTQSHLIAYMPKATDTSLINFILLDYTNLFPYTSTILTISKVINKSVVVVSSKYFDAQGLNFAYLINGEQYSLSVENFNTSSQRGLGGYVPLAPATINLLVSDIIFRPNSTLNGLNQTLTFNSNVSVSLTWTDPNNEIIWQDFRIENEAGTLLYDANTTIHNGQLTYLITSNARLNITITTQTVNFGLLRSTQWYNPGIGSTYTQSSGISMSQNAKNFAAFFLLLVVAYLYGRQHTVRGSLYVTILAVFEWVTGWLIIPILGSQGTGALFIVLLIISIIANISERER